MFRRRFGRRKFLRRGRKQLGKGYRKARISKSVKRYVKKAIHRNIENKEVIQYAANTVLNTASYSTQSLGLLPALGQGIGASGRIANQIKIVSGKLDIIFNLLPYNATTNPLSTPVLVKCWLIKDLTRVEATQYLNNTDIQKVFRGNGVSLPFQNNCLDMTLPINDDLFRVLAHRTFKLGAASATATGQVGTGGYFDNSPMSKHLTFYWGKYVKKSLKFSDNDANYYPQNDNLFILMQAVNADGTTSGLQAVEYHYTNHTKYEDA